MKGLINRITKLWEEIKEAGIFSSIWMALFIGILIFLIFSSCCTEKYRLGTKFVKSTLVKIMSGKMGIEVQTFA